MKAFLLAAGLGTRLRPLTDTTPKCLIPICGKPLMEWWLELFSAHGVNEVLASTHYLPEQVLAFIHAYNSKGTGLRLCEFYEATLLGSGGTIAANRDFAKDEESFLICYADNLTDIDLSELREFHKTHDGILTMALFRTENPEQCGIAALGDGGKIKEFIEKPAAPKSNLANAGIYIARGGLFDYLPKSGFCDFGKDVLPKLAGNMYGFEITDFLMDIGTPERLYKARNMWKHDHL